MALTQIRPVVHRIRGPTVAFVVPFDFDFGSIFEVSADLRGDWF